jgi:hypothetical protein
MSYCTLVRDSKWRGSEWHCVFGGGSAYCDVKGGGNTGSGFVTGNMSFDGAGCMRGVEVPLPQDLVDAVMAVLPLEEKGSYEVPEDSALAAQIEAFYTHVRDQHVEEQWKEDFNNNGVCKE